MGWGLIGVTLPEMQEEDLSCHEEHESYETEMNGHMGQYHNFRKKRREFCDF